MKIRRIAKLINGFVFIALANGIVGVLFQRIDIMLLGVIIALVGIQAAIVYQGLIKQ